LKALRNVVACLADAPDKFKITATDDVTAKLSQAPDLSPASPVTDPDDEWVVASAMAGGADVLVTGDAAVLKLGKRAPLPILSPRGLWDLLRGPEPRR
jgi:predicted nucleic acid-binding protein